MKVQWNVHQTSSDSTRTPVTAASEKEADCFVDVVVESLPITERQLERIKLHQGEDETGWLTASYCQTGWPEKHQLSATVWLYHSEVSVQPGLLMRGCRIIIPFSLHQDMLGKIHAGHQGVTKCRVRARQSVWWPRMSKELEDLAKNCPECFKAQYHQPLIPSPVLELPWQKVATDLFKRKWYMYLLIVDYYSPLHWDNSPERSTCQRGDHAHQKHIRKTRNSGSSHIRQRSTICISSISPVCPGLPVWIHYKQSVFPPK